MIFIIITIVNIIIYYLHWICLPSLSSYAVPDMMQVLVHLFLELLVQFLRHGHQLLEVSVSLLQWLSIVLAQLVVQLNAEVLLGLLRQLLVVLLQYLLLPTQVVV